MGYAAAHGAPWLNKIFGAEESGLVATALLSHCLSQHFLLWCVLHMLCCMYTLLPNYPSNDRDIIWK